MPFSDIELLRKDILLHNEDYGQKKECCLQVFASAGSHSGTLFGCTLGGAHLFLQVLKNKNTVKLILYGIAAVSPTIAVMVVMGKTNSIRNFLKNFMPLGSVINAANGQIDK